MLWLIISIVTSAWALIMTIAWIDERSINDSLRWESRKILDELAAYRRRDRETARWN